MTDEPPRFIHDTRRIIAVNEAAVALFRCDPVALIDQDMMQLIPRADLRGLARWRMTFMRRGLQLPAISYPFLRCDGTIFQAALETEQLGDGRFQTTLIYEREE